MKRAKGGKLAKPASMKELPGTAAHIVSVDERIEAGRKLRDTVQREHHGRWKEFKGRPILSACCASRTRAG